MTIIDTSTPIGQMDRGASQRREVFDRFDTGCGRSLEAMSLPELRGQLALARSARAIVDARVIAITAHLSRRADEGAAVDTVRELRSFAGLRGRDTRTVEAQTAAVAAAPALGELLAHGVTTAGHVEAVGRALDVAGEGRADLLARVDDITMRAATMGVDDFDRYIARLARDVQPDEGLSRFEQQRRSIEVKMWHGRDGMVRWAGAYDPERGAVIDGRLQQQIEAMFHSGDRDISIDAAPGVDPNDHRRALALYALVMGRGDATTTATPGEAIPGEAIPVQARPARAEIVVHIDHQTLVDGLHARSVCRTSHGADIPPDVARRLACDNDIIPVVLSGTSVPLDVGRAKRLATIHQRRALEAIHTTCAIDGCPAPFAHCTVHHLDPWETGGATDLGNLVPLCSRHHHAAHEGRWRLHLDPANRRLSATPPGRRDGTTSPGHDPP
jgi:hypothetical protein